MPLGITVAMPSDRVIDNNQDTTRPAGAIHAADGRCRQAPNAHGAPAAIAPTRAQNP
jgi:hypothetical protein